MAAGPLNIMTLFTTMYSYVETAIATSVASFGSGLVSFVAAPLALAAIVYFFVVKPYTAAQERFFPAEPDADTEDPNTELLKEIRDSLRARPGL